MIPMKTKLHKLASLLLAFALTLCLALPAGAVGGETTPLNIDVNQTGNIKVEGISETADTSVTVNVYRLMTVNFDTTNQQPVEPVYTWVGPVANWLKTNEDYQKYIKAEDNSVTSEFSTPSGDENAQNTKSAEIAGFYDALAAAIRGETIADFSATKSGTATIPEGAETASCTIDDLAMGNYLVLIEGGMKVYRPSAVNLVPVWKEATGAGETSKWVLFDAVVELKSSDLTLTKQVYDGTITAGVIPDWGETAQVAIGNTVTFKLTALVPNYPENALHDGYEISDNLPAGLALGNVTVNGVTNGTPTPLTEGPSSDYVLTRADSTATSGSMASRPTGGQVTFNLEFDYDKIKAYDEIEVTYTATVNADIKVIGQDSNTNGNINTAYLDYNNNPYQKATNDDPLEWVSKEDSAFVYTYGIKVDKVSDKQENGRDVYLPGAEFTLHRTGPQGNKEGEPIRFMAVNPDNGVYRVATQTDTGSITKLTVGQENAAEGAEPRAGKLDIRGLDVGTYILTETKAPDGYNLPSQAFEIIINDSKTPRSDGGYQNGANGKTDTTDDSNHTTEVDDGYVNTKITNTKGFTLPTTGGMGTVLFTAGGVLLMGAGLVVLVLFLRRRTSR